jgi:thiol-disulfide isomerase/thioredoxin
MTMTDHTPQPPRPTRTVSPALLLLAFPLLGLVVTILMIIGAQPVAQTPEPTPQPILLPPVAPTSAVFRTSAAVDFTLPTLDGSSTSLIDFRGQPVILNFWATWCIPCERELPAIAAFLTEQDAVTVLAINIGETADVVELWLAERDLLGAFPVLLDIDTAVQGRYGIFQIPVTFGLDREGVVQEQQFGEVTIEDLRTFAQALR